MNYLMEAKCLLEQEADETPPAFVEGRGCIRIITCFLKTELPTESIKILLLVNTNLLKN